MVAMLRSSLNRHLKNALLSAEVPLISEFKVSEILEEEDQVTVIAEDGRKETGSFVIGCDGLNSVVRAFILKSHGLPLEPVEFTGIVQVRVLLPALRGAKADQLIPNSIEEFRQLHHQCSRMLTALCSSTALSLSSHTIRSQPPAAYGLCTSDQRSGSLNGQIPVSSRLPSKRRARKSCWRI